MVPPSARVARPPGSRNLYRRASVCAKVAALRRAHSIIRIGLLHPLRRTGPKGSGPIRRGFRGTRPLDEDRPESIRTRAEREFGAQSGVALLLRRAHGARDARDGNQPALAQCEENIRAASTRRSAPNIARGPEFSHRHPGKESPGVDPARRDGCVLPT